ncbi:hypothetical protein KAU15_04915, partial [candidate division WOR-3 bacterium]|nr:hypothetical protein [candidate division WOR-3 bacterium]
NTKINQHISIDRQNNIVYYKTMYGDYLLSIDSVKTFDDYIYKDKKNYLSEQFNNMLFKEIAKTSSSSGLIGDIDVPITFGKLGSFLGEGSKLIVDGSERVEFNGAKTIDLNPISGENLKDSWMPELIPFQHLIVSVTGTIGDRIKVNLKHNSQTEQESDNKVKIEYIGDEDDILRSIEAGDIALSLPGVKLIGAPPQHEGLFGIKTTGQLGPLNFTAIASKETGESSSKSFTGNTKSDTLRRYDIEFAKNRFYLTGLGINDSIIEFNLYRDDGNGYNNETQGAVSGNLLVMPGSDDSIIYEGYFIELIEGESNDYIMGSSNQYIELLKDAGVAEGLGISYIIKRDTGQIDTIGSFSYEVGDTLLMKGLKIREDFPGSPTWDYMMRNVYSFSSTNIIPETFSLIIKKVDNASGEDSELQNDKPYIQIMGLDNNNDGIVDYNFVNFNRGYIMFPVLKPFASTDLEEPDDEIYLTNETGYNIGRLYYLEIAYRGAQSVYSLGTFNILEGSEIVTINGRQLTKGSDYTIDYEYGIVTFLTDEANSPDADIKIDYQYTPFLSVMSKNLLGL